MADRQLRCLRISFNPIEHRSTRTAPCGSRSTTYPRPQVLVLLEEHLRNMHEITPEDQVFAFDAKKLRAADVTFWTAWEEEVLLGCAALKELSLTVGEVKSMRTPVKRRRQGVGRALLNHLLRIVAAEGVSRGVLETGRHPAFNPAQTLYRSVGFRECGPFGLLQRERFSVFMSLSLWVASARPNKQLQRTAAARTADHRHNRVGSARMHAHGNNPDLERLEHPDELRVVREARLEEGLGVGLAADVRRRVLG